MKMFWGTLCALAFLAAAAADAQPVAPQGAPPQPSSSQVYPGTRQFTAPPRAVPPTSAQSNNVTLNFPNADVHEVAKAILGDILGLNYAVDPQVQGNVTLETAQPVAKKDVLPIFEEALHAAKMALVKQGDVYTVVALDQAKRQPQLLTYSEPGYGSEAVPLRYVNAVELKKLLDPLVPQNAIAAADASRNLLVVTGTAGERRSIRDLVKQFDVDWMHGMSFALLVPTRTDMHVLLPELDAMVNAKDSPIAGLVRLIPIERLNGIVAISPQPKYLAQLRKWVDILDREGGENERKLFVYHVQNGKASDLATVLVGAFGGSTNPTSPNTPANLTATGQATPISNYRPGFGGFNNNTASGTPSTPGATGFQGTGGLQGGTSGGLGGGSQFGQTGGMTNPGQPGETGGVGGINQPNTIVSQTLMLPGQVTPISITSDDGNNALVFYSTPRQYGLIQDALRQLDVLPLQVLIECAITEVTLTNELQFGVEWRFAGSGGNATLTQNTTAATLAQFFPGFTYFYSNASGNIQAALNALSDITTVKVLSAPKLLVLNNHMASLQVGDQVPILQAQVTSTLTSDASITNEVNYLNTGVILAVTPRVNDSGLVLLDISQQVSDVSATTSSTINSPTINDRMIQSSIAVKDGQTIALGGLIRDSKDHEDAGIPFLNQIPILGNLFNAKNNKDDRTELLILLTPRVIRNEEDVKTVTDELKEKIHATVPIETRGDKIK